MLRQIFDNEPSKIAWAIEWTLPPLSLIASLTNCFHSFSAACRSNGVPHSHSSIDCSSTRVPDVYDCFLSLNQWTSPTINRTSSVKGREGRGAKSQALGWEQRTPE